MQKKSHLQRFILVLTIVFSLIAGMLVIAQEEGMVLLEQPVADDTALTIEFPEDDADLFYTTDDDDDILITNAERLLPPEDADDEYTTPNPDSGEFYLTFLGMNQGLLEALQYNPKDESTAEAVALYLNDLLTRATEDTEGTAITDVELIEIGDYDVATFARVDTDVQRTFLILALNPPYEFLWATVVTLPDEYADFEEIVTGILETVQYVPADETAIDIEVDTSFIDSVLVAPVTSVSMGIPGSSGCDIVMPVEWPFVFPEGTTEIAIDIDLRPAVETWSLDFDWPEIEDILARRCVSSFSGNTTNGSFTAYGGLAFAFYREDGAAFQTGDFSITVEVDDTTVVIPFSIAGEAED